MEGVRLEIARENLNTKLERDWSGTVGRSTRVGEEGVNVLDSGEMTPLIGIPRCVS